MPIWFHDLEALETVSQDEAALDLFLRMARISRAGGMNHFLRELVESDELDSRPRRHSPRWRSTARFCSRWTITSTAPA
jgi:hypothetical protein